MATIKVFDCYGSKELQCFDTLSETPYLAEYLSESDEDLEDEE